MATVSEQIQEIYIGLLGRAADKEGLEYWTAQVEAGNVTVDQVRANIVDSQDEYATGLGAMSREDAVTELYARLFERAPEAEGLEYWVNGEGKDVDVDELVQTMSAGASDDDTAVLTNKTAAAEYYTANAAEYSAATAMAAVADVDATAESLAASQAATDAIEVTPEPEPEPVEGDEIDLTSGTDKLEGTANDDTFDAGLVQNAFAGGVSNSLSSADELDGGAGTDTLEVELVPEFFGVGGGNTMEVQPETSNIEIVELEVQDNFAGNTVVVDAKDMTDIDKIGSDHSDGDLVIENLTTLESDGSVRNTESITITMDHTDNFNSDGDASDLTVYFDEDYLLAGRIEDSNTIQYEVMNQDAWDLINLTGNTDVELLDGVIFQHLSFVLNGETVDLTDALNENGDDLAIRTHEDLAAAINNALVEMGLDSQVTAIVGPNFTERTAVQTGDERDAPTVQIVGQPGVDLTATEDNAFLAPVPEAEREVQASNRYDRAGVTVQDGRDEDITVNIELHKVGRHGEGGNLVVGGKSMDGTEGQGIEVFNVTVLGADASTGFNGKPSNLGQLTSTNGDLHTINIVSEDRSDDSYASLTIRGESTAIGSNDVDAVGVGASPFGGDLDLVNASGFKGDLSLGIETRVDDLGELNATGGGVVTYWGESTGEITTGSADDYINELNSGATINTGAGDDVVDLDAADDTVDIETGSGNDVVDLLPTDAAEALATDTDAADNTGTKFDVNVDLGSGNDTLQDNDEDVTVNSGSGDDAMYLENTGAKGVSGTVDLSNDFGNNLDGMEDNADSGYHMLLGRTVTVTFNGDQGVNNNTVDAYTDGFEATAVIGAGELDGYSFLTSKADLDAAIQEAISDSPVLSKLVSYDATTSTFTSLVDGDDNQVQVMVSATDWTDAQHSSIEGEFQSYVDFSDADVDSEYGEYTVTYDLAGGSDSTFATDNTVVIAAGQDVVALSTDDDSNDTIQFTTSDFGTTYINNFDGNDALDFSAYLNDQETASGSAVSEETIAVSYDDDLELEANQVTSLDFEDGDNSEVTTFAALSESNLTDVFNLTAETYSAQDLVGGTGHSVVMVENDDNEGEYKVFYVDFDGTDGDVGSVDYKGIVDFGASGAQVESAFALSTTASGSTEDGTSPTDPTDPEPTDNIIVDQDVTAVDGTVEVFEYAIDSSTGSVISEAGGDFTITGFTVGEDSIVFNDVATGTVTTETFVAAVTVSESGINNKTDIIFDANSDGVANQLVLAGVVDGDLSTVDFSVA